MNCLLFTTALLVVSSVFASELESQANLLATKTVENKFLVRNQDITIKYTIYNVGSKYVQSKILFVE